MTDIAAAWKFARTRGLHFSLEILVNVVAPFAVYHFAEQRIGEVNALLASMLVPLAWSLLEFFRRRRIDTLSVLVLGSIALSLLAFIGTGSARVLQLRENFVTGLIGLVFLGSAVIRRPLIYLLARAMMQRRSDQDMQTSDWLDDDEQVRRGLMTITIVWGFGLIAQAALASVLVFSVSVSSYLLISPFVSYGTIGVLVLWTLWFSQSKA
jgi:intracellular septation protein A